MKTDLIGCVVSTGLGSWMGIVRAVYVKEVQYGDDYTTSLCAVVEGKNGELKEYDVAALKIEAHSAKGLRLTWGKVTSLQCMQCGSFDNVVYVAEINSERCLKCIEGGGD